MVARDATTPQWKDCQVVTLDLTTTPLSRAGNWLSLSMPSAETADGLGTDFQPLGPGLYLRSNHRRAVAQRELLRLHLHDASDSDPEYTVQAKPSGITISAANDRYIHIVLTNDQGVRVHGNTAVRFEFVPSLHSTLFALPDGRGVANLRGAQLRLEVAALTGDLEIHQQQEHDATHIQSSRMEMIVVPDPDNRLDVALHQAGSAHPQRGYADISDITEDVENDFSEFCKQLPLAAELDQSLVAQAGYILWSNIVDPCGLLVRRTVFMSLNWMDQIWSWDNLFNMCALAPHQPDLAMDQLLVLADHQDAFGAYPDGLNDGFKHYNFGKPPVHGILLHWLRTFVPDFFTHSRLKALYTTTSAFIQFWLNHRLCPERGLPYYLHGNETADNATWFDQGAPLISPDLAAYVITTLEALADMADELSLASDARRWRHEASTMQAQLLKHLWAGDRFIAIRLESGAVVDTASFIGVMPLVLGRLLPEDIRSTLLRRYDRFVTPFGVASEAPDSPAFQEDSYWRGPVWAPITLLVAIVLDRCGEHQRLKQLTNNFCANCIQHGFAENYSAVTGVGLRDRAYTWTASSWLCLSHYQG
jgi:hypothetical protein